MDINSFFLNEKYKKSLQNWINNDYKNKFLFIHGNVSCGKTSLAKILLKKYKLIHINIDFFKDKTSLTNYLDLSLGRKNISMMFNKNYQYNSIIFDNLELFLKHNKSTLNDIILYMPKLQKFKNNHPIIFISSNINHKYFKKIIKYCLFVEINYTFENIINITKNLLLQINKKLSDNEINNLINKSDMKINNIISNIEILKLNNNEIYYDYGDVFAYKILNKIYNTNDFTDIIRYSQNTNNLYFDILDNIHFMIKDLDIIKKIYKTCCRAENINTYFIKNHIDMYDFFILLSIIYPKYYLESKINEKIIINNKYVSKSLIYISNNKNIYNNNLDINLIYLIHKFNNDDFKNFIKDKFNINNFEKKIENVYNKIINM